MATVLTSLAIQFIGQVIAFAVTVVILFVVSAVANSLIVPLVNFALQLSLNPLSIPVVNQIILWSQVCALILVVFFRTGKGVYEGIFQQAATDYNARFNATQWVIKTVLSIACVVIMPLLCNIIVAFGCKAFADISGLVNSGISENGLTLTFQFREDDWWETLGNLALSEIGAYLIGGLILGAVCLYIVKIVYQILKRQFTLLVVSIASIWVAVKTSSDSADDVIDLLVSMVGLVLITIVQFVFLAVAIGMISQVGGMSALIEVDLTDPQTLYAILMMVAAFGCAGNVPQILERYAFSSGRSGAGNMIVGTAVRSGFAAPSSIGRSVVSTFGGASGTSKKTGK